MTFQSLVKESYKQTGVLEVGIYLIIITQLTKVQGTRDNRSIFLVLPYKILESRTKKKLEDKWKLYNLLFRKILMVIFQISA